MTIAVLDNASHPLRSIWNTERLPEALLFVHAAAAAGLGGTLVGLPGVYRASATFRPAFTHLPPWAWGLMMIVPAVLVASTAVLRRTAAWVPCCLLGLVWTAWGLSTIPAVIVGAVPSGTIIYSALGVLTVLSGIVAHVWDDRHRP